MFLELNYILLIALGIGFVLAIAAWWIAIGSAKTHYKQATREINLLMQREEALLNRHRQHNQASTKRQTKENIMRKTIDQAPKILNKNDAAI